MSKNNSPYFDVISLEHLFLDEENPRLPKSIQHSSEKEILEYMLLDASLIELMLAIGKNNFFPGEQLLVIKINEKDYKVIEGNRRLSAVKLLKNPNLVSVQRSKIQQVVNESEYYPTEIPCLVFKNSDEIHNYLGYKHITGIKEWKLLEKARYLFGLWKSQYENFDLNHASRELAKSIGSRKDYVKRILIGYQIFYKIEDEAFYRIPGLDDISFYFNYIADSLNKVHIANYLGIDVKNIDDINEIKLIEKNLENWTKWLFEKNSEGKTRLIGDSSHLNDLNKVLGHEEAKKAFIEKGYSLESAIDLTDHADIQFYNYINNTIGQLENADRLVLKVKVRFDNVSEQIKEIRALATKIGRSLIDKEDDDEF